MRISAIFKSFNRLDAHLLIDFNDRNFMSVNLENTLRESGFQDDCIALILNLIQTYGQSLGQESWQSLGKVEMSNDSPLVVFDCDQTLIQGDLGEVLLKHMWTTGMIKTLGTYEKQAIIAVCHQAHQSEEKVLEAYQYALQQSDRYFGYLWDLYLYICQQKIEMGYLFAAACITHLPKEQRADFCRRFLTTIQKQAQPFHTLKSTYLGLSQIEKVLEFSVDDLKKNDFFDHFNTKREIWGAIQPYLAQRNLVSILQHHQIDVAIISSSNQDMVVLMGEFFEIPQNRCIAVLFDDQTVVEPIPINQQKIDACLHYLGRLPILMVGDSAYDLPLMEKSKFGILIDYQKEKVREKAIDMGAVLQDFKVLKY
jgi:phosphoserine phosphatase